MKKQILISSLIAVGILSSTGLLVINNHASAEQNTANTATIAASTDLVVAKPISTSKNETVYVITDETGATKTRFIGSTIYDGAETLPFNFTVNYYLDGQEISVKDLKGKSGHVKIVYHYNSTATYQGKYIPFVAITGITLDHNKFNNVKVESGKIISESPENYIIAGYGLAGVNQDLGTDFLPDSFSLEADTTNFNLENTYTIFTNDVIADLDTSKLSLLDELANSAYQLEDGINKLVQGATELSSGLATALDGTKQLYDGSKSLSTNLKELATKTTELSTGLTALTDNNAKLQAGANTLIDSTLQQVNASGLFPIEITRVNYSQYLPEGNQARTTIDFGFGIIAYTNGAANAATGANALATGATKLSTGAATISENLGNLVEGQTKLYEGSVTLKDGLTTFKTAGIDKLVNFASKDLTNFTRNARATVNAAGSYRSFGGIDATSVKFIVKTPSI